MKDDSIRNLPKPGEKYRHFKGGIYEIVLLSKSTDTTPVNLVTYKDISNPTKLWTRTLEEFNSIVSNRIFSRSSSYYLRFERIITPVDIFRAISLNERLSIVPVDPSQPILWPVMMSSNYSESSDTTISGFLAHWCCIEVMPLQFSIEILINNNIKLLCYNSNGDYEIFGQQIENLDGGAMGVCNISISNEDITLTRQDRKMIDKVLNDAFANYVEHNKP